MIAGGGSWFTTGSLGGGCDWLVIAAIISYVIPGVIKYVIPGVISYVIPRVIGGGIASGFATMIKCKIYWAISWIICTMPLHLVLWK